MHSDVYVLGTKWIFHEKALVAANNLGPLCFVAFQKEITNTTFNLGDFG